MHLVLKIFMVCWLYGIALHSTCSATCACPETCTNVTEDEPAIPCLFSADHATLTEGRLPNQAVCSNYNIYTDLEEPYCDFVGTSEPILDICEPGALCLVQNPNLQQLTCQKDRYYCNYLLECPANQLLWVQCMSMDLPHLDDDDECMDEVILESLFIPTGKRSVCGSTCYAGAVIVPFSMDINYGASHCCHNYGFQLSSFCVAMPTVKKRATTTDSCLKERVMVIPMDGSLEYSNQTIRVNIQSQRTTKTFKDIQLLFIENKQVGDHFYTDTKLNPLYGYGELEIVGYVAYYRFSAIDPSLIPNPEEHAYITRSVTLLTDIVRKNTYSNYTRESVTTESTHTMDELYEAKLYAEVMQFSSNPFVSGISKNFLRTVDPLLATESGPPSSVKIH